MKRIVVISAHSRPTKINWWRVFVILLGAAILSGCQSVDRDYVITGDPYGLHYDNQSDLPPVVVPDQGSSAKFGDGGYTDTFSDIATDAGVRLGPGCDSVIVHEPEKRKHLQRDEYLCDGGDGLYTSYAGLSEQRGLEPTDTVAQYSTDDGQSHIVASNRVCVYAPRFASTRRVSGIQNREIIAKVGGLHERVRAGTRTIESKPLGASLSLAPEGRIGTTIRHEFNDRTRGLLVDDVDVLWEARRRMIPFEGRNAEEVEQMQQSQLALVERAAAAAIQWSASDAVEVVIDGKSAQSATHVGQPSSVVVFEPTEGDSRLELVKLASTGAAEPGDSVDFTIRFKNVGDTTVSNVKIVDNLATRLEYVADTEDCTLRALFSSADNVAGSTKLIWEIREELVPGDSGVIRFRTRVR